MKICPNCRAQNDDKTSRCIRCGTMFPISGPPQNRNNSPGAYPGQNSYLLQAPPKKSKLVPVLIAIIGILVIAAGILGTILFMKSRDDDNETGKRSGSSDAAATAVTTLEETTSETTAEPETTAETVTETTTATTAAATETAAVTTTQPPAPLPSVTAELISEQAFQGIDVFLIVNGNYYNYSYTCNEYDPSGAVYTTSGTSSDGKLKVSSFSGGVTKVTVNVTPYNIDGTAGSTVSATFVPDYNSGANTNSITPCTRFGTIYSPSGIKVDGLAGSYLIDGGPPAYERHDLTHGWHIKAVNEYFNGTAYWYELYDADDGDYYGWVYSGNISFY